MKRKTITQKFKIMGSSTLSGYLAVAETPEGNVHEITIDIHKEGTMGRAMANAFAAAMNIGLQNGVPLEKYVEHFKGWKFDPFGPVDCSENVEVAESIIDLVMKELEAVYLQGGKK